MRLMSTTPEERNPDLIYKKGRADHTGHMHSEKAKNAKKGGLDTPGNTAQFPNNNRERVPKKRTRINDQKQKQEHRPNSDMAGYGKEENGPTSQKCKRGIQKQLQGAPPLTRQEKRKETKNK